MLNKTIYPAVALLSLLFSSPLLAQSFKSKPAEGLPGELFIEKFLQANPLLPATVYKPEANKRFKYKNMPADNMICVFPGEGFTNQIKVHVSVARASFPFVNIPNGIRKTDGKTDGIK